MADLFQINLLEAKFRDLSFPVSDFRIQISQDLAQHKTPDQDGARVEATGRNPLVFSARIPFYRGLAPGVTENWPDLYPAHHRSFLSAMADRTSGVLVCPSFGEVIVKPVSCSSELRADLRSGEDVSAEWIEAPHDDDKRWAIFASPSPVGQALDAASTLNDPGITPVIVKADPDNRMSIFEAMTKIASYVDQAGLLVRQSVAPIDRLTYRLNVIHDSITASSDPQQWDVKESINRLRDALFQLKMLAYGVSKGVSIYVVPERTSVSQLVKDLKTDVQTLRELNPDIANVFFIGKGTVIKYYRQDLPQAAVAAVTAGTLMAFAPPARSAD